MPAASAKRRDALEVLAGENFRRCHHRALRAGLDSNGHGEKRHDGLAGADIALQKPQHPLWLGQISLDLRH